MRALKNLSQNPPSQATLAFLTMVLVNLANISVILLLPAFPLDLPLDLMAIAKEGAGVTALVAALLLPACYCVALLINALIDRKPDTSHESLYAKILIVVLLITQTGVIALWSGSAFDLALLIGVQAAYQIYYLFSSRSARKASSR